MCFSSMAYANARSSLAFDPCQGAVEKVHRRSAPNFTPPLRVWLPEGKARQRDKGEARRRVGGGTCHRKSSPHRIGLRTNRSASSSGIPMRRCPTLKGGVKFKSVRATQNCFPGVFQQARQGGGRGGWFSGRWNDERGGFFNSPEEEGQTRLRNEGSTESIL